MKIDEKITKYDIEYKDVLCTGVKWRYPENNIFYFTKDGKTYEFTQTENVNFISDIDHIRCVIVDQFLPWWKNERIKELESENAALRERLENAVELPCIRECNADTHLIELCWLTKYGTINTQLFHEEDIKSAEARLAELKGVIK